MRTVYGKLTTLFFLVVIAIMLFLPMRSGMEDHLYAYPRNLRMSKGDSYDITYELDSDHRQAVTYSSLDEQIAMVSADGRVTAMGPGATDIHLDADGGARTTVHVEVVGTPTTVLALNTDYVRMEKGEVTGLSASFNDGADDTRLEWLSQDSAIAEVDSIGRVTAMRGGRTTVYAVAPNGLNAGATVFVHVSGDAVRITPEELTVGTGASLKMDTYYFPDDTTDEVGSWSTSDPSVLTVDQDGTIHAVGVGTAVLSVFTKENLSASSIIKVEQSAEQFDLSPSAVTIERGDSITLEPRFIGADGQVDTRSNAHYIAWSSSSPEIASVDENGRVIGHKSGRVRIAAIADGMTAVCDLRVQVLVHEVTLDQEEVYLLREETVRPIQLLAAYTPADPDDPTITYSTNNDLVAYVSEDGLVTMTGGYGTAIITARAASGAEARFTVNVVTEIPDPDAEPTVNPFATAAPAVDTGAGMGDFSFDDIGTSVQGRKSTDELNGGAPADVPAAPSGGAESGGDASGGFSFDDIGNGVQGSMSFDDIGNGAQGNASVDASGGADAAVSPTSTPLTNVDQGVEASTLFEY